MKREMKWVVALTAALLVQGCKKEEQAGSQGKSGTPAGSAQGTAGAKGAKKAPEGCNSELSQPIEVNYTFTAQCSPYTIRQPLRVEGWELTIEPGVEIRLEGDQRIEVGYGKQSRLIARGTAEKPIRFVSGGRKEPGAWRKILLNENARGSVLEHVLIEHAGKENDSALENKTTEVSIKNVRFVGIRGRAFQESGKARTAEFSGNDLSEAGGAEVLVRMQFMSTPALKGGNKWPEKAVVQLEGEIDGELQVPSAGVPYRVAQQSVFVQGADASGVASIQLAPGVVFQMGEGTRWMVGYAQPGRFEAVGTAEQPIVFTGFGDMRPGDWKGLAFHDKAREPRLEHVRIEFAGEKDGAALRYQGVRGLGTLTNVTIRESAGNAVLAKGDKSEGFTAFSNNTFEELGRATLRMDLHLASKLGPGNVYPPDGAIEIEGDINTDVVLTAQAVPYRVTRSIIVEGLDKTKPATLTLEPGVVVQIEPDAKFNLGYQRPAVLSAVGTPEKPITFTAAGQEWPGLIIYQHAQLQLENAIMEKVAEKKPAIHVVRKGEGGEVKNVSFPGVKLPIRNCVDKKLTLSEVKADPGVKPAVKEGC